MNMYILNDSCLEPLINLSHPATHVRVRSHQVKKVIKGAYYHTRNTSYIRNYISYNIDKILINSFVNSKLDFCNSQLCGLPQHEVSKLQSIQNTAARVITFLRKYHHLTEFLENCIGYLWNTEYF